MLETLLPGRSALEILTQPEGLVPVLWHMPSSISSICVVHRILNIDVAVIIYRAEDTRSLKGVLRIYTVVSWF